MGWGHGQKKNDDFVILFLAICDQSIDFRNAIELVCI